MARSRRRARRCVGARCDRSFVAGRGREPGAAIGGVRKFVVLGVADRSAGVAAAGVRTVDRGPGSHPRPFRAGTGDHGRSAGRRRRAWPRPAADRRGQRGDGRSVAARRLSASWPHRGGSMGGRHRDSSGSGVRGVRSTDQLVEPGGLRHGDGRTGLVRGGRNPRARAHRPRLAVQPGRPYVTERGGRCSTVHDRIRAAERGLGAADLQLLLLPRQEPLGGLHRRTAQRQLRSHLGRNWGGVPARRARPAPGVERGTGLRRDPRRAGSGAGWCGTAPTGS